MMKGRSGEVLWDDTIRLGIELRKKMRAVRREFEEKESDPARRWFFDPFVPDRVTIRDAAREGATHEVAVGEQCRPTARARPAVLGAGAGRGLARLHGARAGLRHDRSDQAHAADPGFDRATGDYEAHGIPAPVVAQYLRENRVVPEKNDLNSLLFLLTPGVESSKAGTLVSALVAFKRLHDDNALLDDVMPEFVARRPARYRGRRLDLCAEMHAFFRDAGASQLQQAQFAAEHLPEMAMTPHEAVRHLVRNNVDYVPLEALEGRIATTLFVVYPPGIATIVPGERLTSGRGR